MKFSAIVYEKNYTTLIKFEYTRLTWSLVNFPKKKKNKKIKKKNIKKKKIIIKKIKK